MSLMVLLCLVWGIGLVLTNAARQIRDLSRDSMQRTQAGKEIAAAAGALELAVTRFSKKEAPPRGGLAVVKQGEAGGLAVMPAAMKNKPDRRPLKGSMSVSDQ